MVAIQPTTVLTTTGGSLDFASVPTGHLGYVESVAADGSFSNSQYALAHSDAVINTVTVTVTVTAASVPTAGLEFIGL